MKPLIAAVVVIPMAVSMATAQYELPKWLTKYRRAEYTQAIATTNERPSIDKVHRSRTELKYRVPGGLENATGWRSDLYAWASSSDGGLWRLPVKNSFGFYQWELGYYRTYDDGSVFVDVLTNTSTGKVFEVRKAVKGMDARGRWHRFVDYRDPSQRPLGYRRVRSSECRSCHADAGSGGYAVGLAPGADTVFSFPFSVLER